MEKIRQIDQYNIDQQVDSDRQVAKTEEEREQQRANKVVTHEDLQQLERNYTQHEGSQQNKKPRTEEPVNQKVTNNSLLTMLHKRKADQYHYITIQAIKKVKADKKAEQVTPIKVTISSILAKQLVEGRAGARARAPSQSPARREKTEVSGSSADRPRYSERPA